MFLIVEVIRTEIMNGRNVVNYSDVLRQSHSLMTHGRVFSWKIGIKLGSKKRR